MSHHKVVIKPENCYNIGYLKYFRVEIEDGIMLNYTMDYEYLLVTELRQLLKHAGLKKYQNYTNKNY